MDPTRPARRVPPLLVGLAFLLLYVALDAISYWHPIAPVAITPWNPPPGLSIALLLLFGQRHAPLLFIGALTAEWWVRNLPAPLPVLCAASAVLAGGYAATALVLARVLPERRLQDAQQLTRFITITALASAIIGATFVAVFHVAGVLSRAQIGDAVLQFWIGDVIGILVVVPFILSFRGDWPGRASWHAVDGFWLLLLAALLWYIFALESTDEFRLFYLLFVPLIALSLRHGLHGATLAVAMTQVALIVLMKPRDPPQDTIRDLQALLIIFAITGLYVGVIINERRRAQQQLLRQQIALASANRMAAVSELSSALAHELNQPLTAITLYVRACQRLLKMRGEHPEIIDVMDRIGSETQRAGAVVHRLRDFFRSGALQLREQDVNTLAAGVIDSFRERARQQNVQLQLDSDARNPRVLVDPLHLQTVIDNLLRNAFEALGTRRDGRVQLVIRSDADSDTVTLSVNDNAGGVAEHLRAHLFETLTTSKPEGLGMGLAICRQLIEAHGGQLEHHALAGGAQFLIRLPLAPAGTDNAAPDDAAGNRDAVQYGQSELSPNQTRSGSTEHGR